MERYCGIITEIFITFKIRPIYVSNKSVEEFGAAAHECKLL